MSTKGFEKYMRKIREYLGCACLLNYFLVLLSWLLRTATQNMISLGYFNICITLVSGIIKLTVFRKVGHNTRLRPELEYFYF